MKNIRFCWQNLADSGTVTASTEASGFPATNVQHIWLSRKWRSTGKTSEWLKCDLGSEEAVQAVILAGHNLTASAVVYVEANSIDSWSSPPVKELMTVTDEVVIYLWEQSVSYRWWRFTFSDNSNPNSYLEVGRLFIGSYFEPSVNFDWKEKTSWRSRSKIIESVGGQVTAIRRDQRRVWEYSFGFLNSTDIKAFREMWEAVDVVSPYFIIEDADDLEGRVLYVRNGESAWEIEPQDPVWSRWSLKIMAVEEL